MNKKRQDFLSEYYDFFMGVNDTIKSEQSHCYLPKHFSDFVMLPLVEKPEQELGLREKFVKHLLEYSWSIGSNSTPAQTPHSEAPVKIARDWP